MGKIIKDGVEHFFFGGGSGSGDNIEILTRAEYDALVGAGTVDMDAYYFITDASVEGSGGNSGSSGNDNVINNGNLEFTYDSESGYPKWRQVGTEEWHFFKHRHIGASGVPDETLTDDAQLTEAVGCFTKIQHKYHTHDSSCYSTVYKQCMQLVPHWDPDQAAEGAKVWKCSVCGRTSGDTGTSTTPTDPCYHYVDTFTCTKTEGTTVDGTYYVCNCGRSTEDANI